MASNSATPQTSPFEPLNSHGLALCAFHTYAQDPKRQVRAHHYCNHIREDFHQCIIYDSDKKDARLIGIEYIVSEEIFKSLPAGEKRYWHSHQYEIESGLLVMQASGVVTDAMELPLMAHLRKCYGKTIHTWAFDIHPEYPLGPPQLMYSLLSDKQLDEGKVKLRDEELGVSTARKSEYRMKELEGDVYEVDPAADVWTSGRVPQLDFKDTEVKQL